MIDLQRQIFRNVHFGIFSVVNRPCDQVQQQPQETSPQHPGVVRLHVDAFYFSTTVILF